MHLSPDAFVILQKSNKHTWVDIHTFTQNQKSYIVFLQVWHILRALALGNKLPVEFSMSCPMKKNLYYKLDYRMLVNSLNKACL